MHGERGGAKKTLVERMYERDNFKDLVVDGRIILKWIFKSGMVGMEWINLVQDKDGWRAVVNAVMNLRFP